MDWSGRNLTPAGCRGKVETPQAQAEEARLPPRGKQVPVAESNGLCAASYFIHEKMGEDIL
ncbi:hypothetical protein B5V90_13990 [Heyndrickxia sporothermodurans]|nr:hypothetical protein B5V90_13990 [Heyndrickxia sporothermodurans]